MGKNSPQIRPIAGALGAEIAGVDLSDDLDDDEIAAIRRAWLDHLVIFFRGQELPPERFLAFARHFGEVVEYPFIKGIEGFPLITPVVKLEHERVNFGGLWHSDTAYLDRPPMGTMLIAREVPPYGGDTLFANMYLAYETLSPGMRRLLDGLVAVNSSAKADVTKTREDRLRDGAKPDARDEYVAEHPVVRTHPETGKKSALRQSRPHGALQGHERGGERAAVGLSVHPSAAPGIHLPLPLGGRYRSPSGTIAAPSTTRSTTITAGAASCTA